MKICSAHQPAFLPWLGLLHKVAQSDFFIVMDIAKFRKRSFMHRNTIEINGEPHYVGLTLNKESDFLTCDKIHLSPNSKDSLLMIANKIEHTYKKSPYKKDLDEFVNENLLKINGKVSNLLDIYLLQLRYLCKKFNIKTQIVMESSFLSKDKIEKLGASKRLLAHAIHLKANLYITGINSKNYLDEEIFSENNIIHRVQNFNYSSFLKFQHCSSPLSIVHQIAFMGFENIKIFFNKVIEDKTKI